MINRVINDKLWVIVAYDEWSGGQEWFVYPSTIISKVRGAKSRCTQLNYKHKFIVGLSDRGYEVGMLRTESGEWVEFIHSYDTKCMTLSELVNAYKLYIERMIK